VELKVNMPKFSSDAVLVAGTLIAAIAGIAVIAFIGVNAMQKSMDANMTQLRNELSGEMSEVRKTVNNNTIELRKEFNGRFDKLEEKIDKVEERLQKLEIAVTAHIAGHSRTPKKTTATDAPTTAPGDSALPADLPAQGNEAVDAPLPPEKAATPQEPGRQNHKIPEPENLT